MQRYSCHAGSVAAALGLLAGCASLPHGQGAAEVRALVDQRNDTALNWNTANDNGANTTIALDDLLKPPLTQDRAVEIALLHNPRMQGEFARLGIAQADVFEASRIANPTFSVSSLDPHRAGEQTRFDTGLGASFAELLLLPSRKRLALGEFERSKELIGNAVLNLICDVRAAWFNAIGAQQVASTRDAIAGSAATSAQLAAKFHDAGNIAALELKLQQAAATQARLQATRAHGDAIRARSALNQLLGLSGEQIRWQVDTRLPAPLVNEEPAQDLLALAQWQRLDLRAAQQEVTLLEENLDMAQRFRWLGRVDVGIASERDDDGIRLSGPTLSLQLPIFNQGQASVARANAQLTQSRARLRLLQVDIDSSVRLGVERIAAARTIAEDYRAALIPEREAIVAHTQEKANFALVGAFELLLTRQQEYDAYQGYLEAVRDYWLARVELARAVGARLPGDAVGSEATIDASDVPDPPPHDINHAEHDMRDMQQGDISAPVKNDSATTPGVPAPSPTAHQHAGATP